MKHANCGPKGPGCTRAIASCHRPAFSEEGSRRTPTCVRAAASIATWQPPKQWQACHSPANLTSTRHPHTHPMRPQSPHPFACLARPMPLAMPHLVWPVIGHQVELVPGRLDYPGPRLLRQRPHRLRPAAAEETAHITHRACPRHLDAPPPAAPAPHRPTGQHPDRVAQFIYSCCDLRRRTARMSLAGSEIAQSLQPCNQYQLSRPTSGSRHYNEAPECLLGHAYACYAGKLGPGPTPIHAPALLAGHPIRAFPRCPASCSAQAATTHGRHTQARRWAAPRHRSHPAGRLALTERAPGQALQGGKAPPPHYSSRYASLASPCPAASFMVPP
jgi:hypothetical protein